MKASFPDWIKSTNNLQYRGLEMKVNAKFVVTGGPGAGKTTILNALANKGFPFAPESARRIIQDRVAVGLPPRQSPSAFAREILYSDIRQYRAFNVSDDPVFYDRGVLDALYMLDAVEMLSSDEAASYTEKFPYNTVVFFLPPWADIYRQDSERDQTFQESLEIFEAMKRWYSRWGYQVLEVPRTNVDARVAFIEAVNKALTSAG